MITAQERVKELKQELSLTWGELGRWLVRDDDMEPEVGVKTLRDIAAGRREPSLRVARLLGVKRKPKRGKNQFRRAASFATEEEAAKFDEMIKAGGFDSITEMVRSVMECNRCAIPFVFFAHGWDDSE